MGGILWRRQRDNPGVEHAIVVEGTFKTVDPKMVEKELNKPQNLAANSESYKERSESMQDPNSGDMKVFSALQAALDEANKFDPPAAVFTVGEEVELKGGRFRVQALGKHFVRLESLPRKMI